MQILEERNNGEQQPVEVGMDLEVGDSAKIKKTSSQKTQKYGNQAHKIEKRKVDHLEGECKKIKPTSFYWESITGEEEKAWLLDIKK